MNIDIGVVKKIISSQEPAETLLATMSEAAELNSDTGAKVVATLVSSIPPLEKRAIKFLSDALVAQGLPRTDSPPQECLDDINAYIQNWRQSVPPGRTYATWYRIFTDGASVPVGENETLASVALVALVKAFKC